MWFVHLHFHPTAITDIDFRSKVSALFVSLWMEWIRTLYPCRAYHNQDYEARLKKRSPPPHHHKNGCSLKIPRWKPTWAKRAIWKRLFSQDAKITKKWDSRKIESPLQGWAGEDGIRTHDLLTASHKHLFVLISWRYRKHWDSGITRDSKRMFGIFRTKNSSQRKALPGNNSLNLIWFIYSIYIRPILQNVY